MQGSCDNCHEARGDRAHIIDGARLCRDCARRVVTDVILDMRNAGEITIDPSGRVRLTEREDR
jgi:hypothetical protein